MRAGKILIGIGIFVMISGAVFFLQGQSVVGPTYSFMYSNPQWKVYGQWVAVIGLITLIVGVLVLKTNLRFQAS